MNIGLRKKIAVAGFCALSASLAAAETAQPAVYWFTANKGGEHNRHIAASGVYRLESSGADVGVDWVDGNWLYIWTAGTPDWLTPVITDKDPGSLTVNGHMKVYGINFRSGGRSWGDGGGSFEIGAGGFVAPDAWGTLKMTIAGGVHLTASQTWTTSHGVNFNTPVTSADGVVWTLYNPQGNVNGLFSFAKANELSGCDLVLTNAAKLTLTDAAATVKAKSLTIDGAGSYVKFDAAVHEPVFGEDYAKELVLRNGAALSSATTFEGVTLDFEKITVTNGTSAIGSCESYTIADSGAQPLVVAEGATVHIVKEPAQGRFSVTGGGVCKIDGTQWPKADLSGFTGILEVNCSDVVLEELPANISGLRFSGKSMRIDDLSGFSGVIELSGSAKLVLPASGTWGEGARVSTAGNAKLYLPYGAAVDAGKITGTANYESSVRGFSTESVGTVTVAEGGILVVGGDGFTAGTKIVLNGGKLYFVAPSVIASDVEVAADSFIGSAQEVTGTVSGFVTVDSSQLMVTNDFNSAGYVWRGDHIYRNDGTVKFTGGGLVDSVSDSDRGTLNFFAGQLELSGGAWTFVKYSNFLVKQYAHRALLSDGVQVVFEPSLLSYGLEMATDGNNPCTLEIGTGSLLEFGRYAKLKMGGGYTRSSATLLVNGGTCHLKSPDSPFDVDSTGAKQLAGTSNDRCAMVNVKVTNGGVLKTDRVFISRPVSHVLDNPSSLGRAFVSGVHLTLDGGTYKLGEGFGADAKLAVSTANHLFAATSTFADRTTMDYGHTAEITVNIGPGGGTFDFSDAKTNETVYSCTVVDNPLPVPEGGNYTGGEYLPCLGPRWNISGPLTVKGHGAQEFVMHAFTDGQLSAAVADGMKGVSVVTGEVDSVTLGSLAIEGRGSWGVVDEDGAALPLEISALTVRDGGVYDAALFDASVSVGRLTFENGSTLAAGIRAGEIAMLEVAGPVDFASEMKYFAPYGSKVSGVVFETSGAVGDTATSWIRAEGSSRRAVETGAGKVIFVPYGMNVILR